VGVVGSKSIATTVRVITDSQIKAMREQDKRWLLNNGNKPIDELIQTGSI
jgi:hypothetical protein